MTKIDLGDRAKDQNTGFEGIVTGLCQYITDLDQVLLTPKPGDDGVPNDSLWFNEQQVTVIEAKAVKIVNGEYPGFDQPTPIR